MAHKDAKSLPKLFKHDKLLDDPKAAAKDAGASDELGEFLGGLSPQERQVLIDTWDHMSKRGITGKADDVTVAFL